MKMAQVLRKYIRRIEYKSLNDYLAVTDIKKRIVYLNKNIAHFSQQAKDIIIAHECAHIIVKTLSHNYVWEKVFFDLIQQIKRRYEDKKFNKVYVRLLTEFAYKRNGKLLIKRKKNGGKK